MIPNGYSQVIPRLFMGSAPPCGTDLSGRFDVLVLCAREYQPPGSCFPGVEVVHCPLDDAGFPPTVAELKLAQSAAGHVLKHLSKKHRVLVTCQKGLNRSGLVVGMVLRHAGMRGHEVVDAVRAARGRGALSNRWFVKALIGSSPRAALSASP